MPRVATLVVCLALSAVTARALSAQAAAADRPDAWPAAAPESELLAVRINEVDQEGEVLAVRLSAHSLAVPVSALAAWRLRVPATGVSSIGGQPHLSLDAIPGVRWQVDSATQTLVITVPSAAFLRNDFEVVSQLRPAQAVASLGGFVNYDLHWQRDGGLAGAPATQASGGLVEVGAFNAQGNGRSSAVFRQAGGTSSFTRLDTTWNVDMPTALSSVRVGDAIGTPGAWGRSVRFGGLQWATNFAVQPGLVSMPMPAIRGEANVPSIVDLYVNSTHQLQGKVPPGAFDLPEVPVVTGAGQIRMVVRDLLGREQVIVQPYYVSPALLRAGLHDFAVEAGAIRKDYGLASDAYGRAMLTATDRQGVTDEFTREIRVELLKRQQTVGASGVWLVRQLATANLSAVVGRGSNGAGALVVAGVDHQGADWSAGVQGRMCARGFTQLGQAVGLAADGTLQTVRSMLSANFGTTVGNGGLGLTLLQQSTWQGDSYRSLSANYGRSLGNFGYLGVFASRTAGSSHGTSLGINLIRSFGDDATVSASGARNRDRSVGSAGTRDNDQQVLQVQGAAPVGPGFGYQLQAERGGYARSSGDATWQTEKLAMTAGAAQANGAASFRAGMSGALAVMPEGVFASRRIDGSFAVVQVGDYEGVRVNRDNQLVGRTDERGLAFIPGLRGFESNRISVEPGDLPLDAQVDDLHVAVAPGMGSGVSVRFPVRRSRAASLRLLSADGSAVPAGSWVRVDGGTREFPVGLDGKLFLAGLAERSDIRAEWEGHACSAHLDIAPGEDAVPELGAVTCR